jgi:hypothetical protein
LGVVVVLLVATIGVLLTVQGWKSRVPFIDLVPPIDDAYGFLRDGRIPEWGRGNSLGSYAPAGTFWLLIPGISFVADPRLFEYVGGAILYLGTLVGVFLLARSFFGISCALLAVVLYGLSELGLYFAGSLWPKGHPFFYVWMLYFAAQWVNRRDARYFAAAVVTLAAGMLLHMELAPAFFILPALWFFYRAPIKLWPLLIGIALVLLIWFPYLRFEYSRGFSDVTSQVFLAHRPTDYKRSWCDPALLMQSLKPIAPPNSDLHDANNFTRIRQFVKKATTTDTTESGLRGVKAGLFGNFRRALRLSGVSGILLSLTVSSLILLSLIGAGRTILSRRWMSAIFTHLPISLRPAPNNSRSSHDVELMVLFLLIPWGLLLYSSVQTEYLVATRFWWLWPGQVIVLAALVTFIPDRLRAPRALAWTGQIMLVLLLIGNPLLLSKIESFSKTGWSGYDSDEKKVVDYVANDLLSEKRYLGSIGYQTLFYEWMPRQNVLDPRIKVGLEFDLLFRVLYNITNTDRCAEGVSPSDEYKIVQIAPSATMAYPFAYAPAPKARFEIPLDDSFYMLNKFGPYLVLKRNMFVKSPTERP